VKISPSTVTLWVDSTVIMQLCIAEMRV